MTSVGVIGDGVVGHATAELFGATAIYDPPKGYADPSVLADCEIIFLSVPVPTVTGQNDLTILHQALGAVSPVLSPDQIIAVRSTVLPGTNRALQEEYPGVRFASNPEFLRAHRAVEDARHPHRVVIGADDRAIGERIAATYRERLDPGTPFIHTDTRTAEMIKYAANAYLAMKISYVHEIWDACRLLEIDFDSVRRALAADPRIGDGEANEELNVRPDRLGFDDECLPKDLAAFTGFLTRLGMPALMLQATATVNSEMLSRSPAAD